MFVRRNFHLLTESESELSDVPHNEFLKKLEAELAKDVTDSSDSLDTVAADHIKLKNQGPPVTVVEANAEAAVEVAELPGVVTRSRARALAIKLEKAKAAK